MSEPFEFLIEVVDRTAEGYVLRVAFPDPDLPAGTGENRAVAVFDAGDAEFRGRLAVLPTSVLASAAKARHSANPLEETARDIGDRLFRAVTVGESLGDLSRLRRRALAVGADVRISLRIQAPELAALPWEYLFDARPDRREFLGRSCMVTRSAGAFGAVTAPSPHPHELTHRESGSDGRDAGPAPVHGILLDPSGRTVACQAGAGRPPQHLVLWTMADIRPHRHPGGHFAYLPGRPDGYVASEGSTGLAIRTFQSDKMLVLENIETVRALAVSGDGSHIAAAGQNRTRLWTGDGGFVRYVPSAASTRHVALSPDGDRLVVPESPTRLAVHDTESGHVIARIPIDADASHAWELGGSGLLVTTTREGLTLWDPESPSKPVHCIRGSFANTVRPAFTPAGDVLVARSVDGTHVHTYRLDVSPV